MLAGPFYNLVPTKPLTCLVLRLTGITGVMKLTNRKNDPLPPPLNYNVVSTMLTNLLRNDTLFPYILKTRAGPVRQVSRLQNNMQFRCLLITIFTDT